MKSVVHIFLEHMCKYISLKIITGVLKRTTLVLGQDLNPSCKVRLTNERSFVPLKNKYSNSSQVGL